MTFIYLNYGAQMDVRVVAALLCIEHEDVAKQWEEITICASQWEELTICAIQWEELINDS